MLGLTIKRPDTAPKVDESFQSTRPELPESKDAIRLNHVTPPIVDHTPAKPIAEQAIERAKSTGNDRLAELLAKAEAKAKEQAKVIEKERRVTTNGQVRAQKKRSESAEVISSPQVLFTPEDVCSDEEFIKRSIDTDIHTKEMKRLFHANGGQAYLDVGLLYGQAFDMLKSAKATVIRIKQQKLIIGKDEPLWKRVTALPSNSKAYVSGLPTIELRLARQNAEEDAAVREETEEWLANN